MLQHLFGGVFLEVDQLKQLDPVALRGEDQLMFFAIEAHLEGDLIKNQVQGFLRSVHQFLAPGVVLVLVHHLAQLRFHFGKGFPRRFRPLPEARRELRQGNALPAPFDKHFGILVAGTGFQCFFKVPQGAALLVQIVVGIPHAEVPAVVTLEVFLMGLQQGDGLFKQVPPPWLVGVRQIAVGPGQLAVHLRGTFLGGDGLQRVDDFLKFVLFMPFLALFQNIHSLFLLVLFRFPVFDLLKHAVPVPLKGAGRGTAEILLFQRYPSSLSVHLHPDHGPVEVVVAVQFLVILHFRLAVGRTGKETEKNSQPTADAASAITAAGGKLFRLHDLPHIGIIGNGQAEEVGSLHIEGLVLVLRALKMVQMHGIVHPIPPGEQGAASATAQVGPFVCRGKGEALLFQPGKKRIVVCAVIDPDLKAAFHPFNAGRLMQGQAFKVAPGEVPEFLQPVGMGGYSGIGHLDRLPAELLQLSPHQHGADGRLAYGGHALPDQRLRGLFDFPFPEQLVQLLPAVGIQPRSKVVPAQGDGVAGNKDELPAVLFKHAGGAALPPAVKGMQAQKGHSITGSQAFHQRLFLGGFHLMKLRAE